MSKSRIRIKGEDRALMMLCRQARRYWKYYSTVYKTVKEISKCNICNDGKVQKIEVDHFPALGPRPRTIGEFPDWWTRLMTGPQFGLCIPHHREKTKQERKHAHKL